MGRGFGGMAFFGGFGVVSFGGLVWWELKDWRWGNWGEGEREGRCEGWREGEGERVGG